MKRVFIALLMALLAALSEIIDDDPDSDTARFMIVVEHEDGYHCSASLVSMRTGVTTARCARGRGGVGRRELWALAAELISERPRARLAAAARRVTRIALAGDGRDPDDPALDMALLELETPFGSEAHSQPILMATSRDACDAPPICHAIRALPALPGVSSTSGHHARLRVVRLQRADEKHCFNRVPHWAASRARMLCLTGDELCEHDLGGGVVCGGKLCGVLSAAVEGEEGAGRNTRAGPGCGTTLAAQSVAHWRHFLHCAYTFRLCGSGDCAGQCTEQRLIEDEKTIVTQPTQDPITREPINHVTIKNSSLRRNYSVQEKKFHSYVPTHTDGDIDTDSASSRFYPSSPIHSSRQANSPLSTRLPHTTRTSTASSLPFSLFYGSTDAQLSLRPLPEFEPNRPDFKAASIQPTRVGLKAGEYGDNAAEYGGEEAAPAATPSTTSSPPELQPALRRRLPAPAPLSAPSAQAVPAVGAQAPQTTATSGTSTVYTPCTLILNFVMGFLE